MKKQTTSWVFSGMCFATALLLLVYSLIAYNQYLFVIIITGILFLASTFFMLRNVEYAINKHNLETKTMLSRELADLADQLNEATDNQLKIAKASYICSKQNGTALEDLANANKNGYSLILNNLKAISDADLKTTKLLIKYNDTNTHKLMSCLNDNKSTLSNVSVQGFDQVQQDTEKLISQLQDIKSAIANIEFPEISASTPMDSFVPEEDAGTIYNDVALPKEDENITLEA